VAEKIYSGYIPDASGAELKVVVDGTNHTVYYNGSQVGTTQTINNATLGTKVYGFSSYSGNTVGLVQTS
jgi:hypothetical protein